jgi:hypothetical protein
MSFDNSIYLVSGGTNYYLSGSTKTNYTGSGTPWTAENTSPYRLSLNDSSPIWVPQPTPATMQFTGGPPFRIGSSPLYRGYDNLTESVGVQMYANSADNAIFLLRQLRSILNTALYSVPCILAVQSGTNTAYYEIYSADVTETNAYLTEGSSSQQLIRATITWVRSAVGGVASLTTLINGVTWTNTVAGSTTLGALTGDFVYEGSPMNVEISGGGGTTVPYFYVGTILSNTTASPATAKTTTTTLPSYDTWLAGSSTSISGALTNNAVKLRLVATVSTLTAPTKIYTRASIYLGNAAYTTNPIQLGSNTSKQFIDFGGIDLSPLRIPYATDAKVKATFFIASSDGTSVTATIDSYQFILYYDWAQCRTTIDTGSSLKTRIIQASNVNGTAWIAPPPEKIRN